MKTPSTVPTHINDLAGMEVGAILTFASQAQPGTVYRFRRTQFGWVDQDRPDRRGALNDPEMLATVHRSRGRSL